METRFLKPGDVSNQKLFNRYACKKNLYDLAADVCKNFCEINHTYGDLILKVELWSKDYNSKKLENKYTSTVFAEFNGDEFTWTFDNDFDEGEDAIVVTNICYLFEVFEND